jgi:hypothetical protein
MQSEVFTTLDITFYESAQFNNIEADFSENLGTYVF